MAITLLHADEISCWLPFTASPFFVEDYYGNMQLYPSLLPQKREYKLLHHAIIRAQLRSLSQEGVQNAAQGTESLIVGPYVSVTNDGIVVQELLFRQSEDIREIVQIILDGLAPSSTAFLYEFQGQQRVLCWACCLEGDSSGDSKEVGVVSIKFANGTEKNLAILPNRLVWLQKAMGMEAMLEYSFHKATINGTKSGSLPFVFGEAGVVIDSRGRPFPAPEQSKLGQQAIGQWLGAIDEVHLL